jgi:hypothetical protein
MLEREKTTLESGNDECERCGKRIVPGDTIVYVEMRDERGIIILGAFCSDVCADSAN